MFKQAMWLAKKELKYQWIAFLLTVIVTIVFALFTSTLLDQAARKLFGEETMYYNFILLDILFVAMTPSLAAIYISKPYLNIQAVKDDPFSKRMAFLRSLPISVSVLALSRTLIMLTTLLVMSVAFYITITIALPDTFFSLISLKEYGIFVLFWFGYALAIGGVNPFIEFGTNGKILHLNPFISIVIFLVVVLNFYHFVGQGVVEWVITLVKIHGLPFAVYALLIGAIGSYGWNILLLLRLKKRDYL